jgi:hypothetical protein
VQRREHCAPPRVGLRAAAGTWHGSPARPFGQRPVDGGPGGHDTSRGVVSTKASSGNRWLAALDQPASPAVRRWHRASRQRAPQDAAAVAAALPTHVKSSVAPVRDGQADYAR